MERDKEIVEEDSQQHPNCSYAVSLQKSCSNKNGDFTCETIRKINRMCPNKKSVVIFSESETESGKKDISGSFDPFSLFKGFDLSDMEVERSSPPEPAVPRPPDSGFQFKFGGNLVDEDDSRSSGLLDRFGFGSSKKNNISAKVTSKSKNDDPPKPPAGT